MTSQPGKKVSVAVRRPQKSGVRLVEDRNNQIRHETIVKIYWKSLSQGQNVRREPCDCNACVLVSVIESIATGECLL